MGLLKQEKGAALSYVIVLIMLMGVLGSTAMVVMASENKQGNIFNNKTQAYYLARSGAEIAQGWLEEIDYQLKEPLFLNGCLETGLKQGQDIERPINVEIYSQGDKIEIESVGNYRGQTQLVKLTIQSSTNVDNFNFDKALFAANSIEFAGSSKIIGCVATDFNDFNQISFTNSGGQYISGDIYVPVNSNISKEQIYNGHKIQGQVKDLKQPYNFTLPEFPDFPDFPQHPNVDIKNGNNSHGV